ncbi:MAG: M56 family metallopeptidase [Myxococcota bacterium]
MTFLATLGLVAGLWLLALAACSLAVAAVWPLVRRGLPDRHPDLRSRRVAGLAMAPMLVSGAAVVLCLAPGLLGLVGWTTDHCLAHPDHPHLCLVHPTAELTATAALLLAAGIGALLLLAGHGARQVAGARRIGAPFAALCTTQLAPGVDRVVSERPFSFTSGLLRPVAYVSSALCEALSPEALAVVVAHERAHVRRRDPLRWIAAATLSLALPPAVRRELIGELELASEQACDEAAARAVGDRLRVAETLLAAERLMASADAGLRPAVAGLGGSAVPARVRSLLDAPRPRPRNRAGTIALGLLAALALAADPIHHGAEHLVEWLLLGH